MNIIIVNYMYRHRGDPDDLPVMYSMYVCSSYVAL